MTALTVNGRAVETTFDGPLLHLLRGELALFAAKLGCGEGNCGACTVIVNGQAVQSCQTPLWDLEGAEVRTVEGLRADDPVIAAFMEENAAQCGFCIPGILMTVTALRDQGKGGDLLQTLDERHICRCGTHMRILRAARTVL